MAEFEVLPSMSAGDDEIMRAAELMTSSTPEPTEDEEKPEGEKPVAEGTEVEAEAPVEADAETETDEVAAEGEDKAEVEEDDTTPEWDKEAKADEELAATGGQYASPKAKVKMPDGTETTISTLMEGAMRQEDYTQKTQAVAQQRQYVEQMAQSYQAKEQQLDQTLALAFQVLQSQIPPEPTAQMRQEDPFAYMDAKASHDEAIGRLQAFNQALGARQQNMTQQQQQEFQQRTQQHQQTELSSLLMKMPVLRDPQNANRFIADAQKAAERYGFTPAEFQLTDHRYAMMMADAIRYHRLKENSASSAVKGKAANTTKKSSQSQAPVMKAGKRVAPTVAQSQQEKQIHERFQQTGDIWDAAALLTQRQKAARQ